jgi:hypothetical protein
VTENVGSKRRVFRESYSLYAITKAAAAARPARANDPVLTLAAPVKVATAGATGVLGQHVSKMDISL